MVGVCSITEERQHASRAMHPVHVQRGLTVDLVTRMATSKVQAVRRSSMNHTVIPHWYPYRVHRTPLVSTWINASRI